MAEKMEKDAAELPGISREAEEHQLAYVIGVAHGAPGKSQKETVFWQN